MVWCGGVWCGVVCCGVVWCGVVWCGVVWCGVVWCIVVWCGVVWFVVWCGVVWCGVVWCGVVWCGVVWSGLVWFVVWCGVVWCGVVWCGVVWCGVVWCGLVWSGMVWFGVVWFVVWCGVVWCGVVWCGVVWCGVAWRGVAWCGVVWCGVVWCGVVVCGVVWCGVVWCGVVWCGVVWCGVVWCGVVWCGVVWCGVVVCGVVWWGGVLRCAVLRRRLLDAFSILKMEPLQPGLSENSFRSWWSAEGNSKLQRIALLKAIEAATAAVYEREVLSLEPDARKRSQVRAVVLESNLAGLDEFGPEWYECIRAKMQRMTLCAEWIVLALDAGAAASGFDAFERALVAGAARMLPAYNRYYLDFLAAVRDEAVIAALQAHRPPPDAAAIHSHYTVVRCGAAGLSAVPFATHFAPALADVLARFDEWIAACRAADAACGDQSAPWDAEARATYVAFLQQYRDALALNAEAPALEAAWTELDRRWMDTKMPIQIVHDIETGYGDPLRVKATPDMSLRFLDESFAEANATIADIQRRMEAFYRRRDTPLARDGLQALSNTMAGIYFIPFKTGVRRGCHVEATARAATTTHLGMGRPCA